MASVSTPGASTLPSLGTQCAQQRNRDRRDYSEPPPIDDARWRQLGGTNPRTLFSSLGTSSNADCLHPQFDCVRRLAADRTQFNTQFASSCGSAMIKFNVDAIVLQLFRDGTQAGGSQYYEPITGVTSIYGTTSPFPDTLYVGVSGPGWFLTLLRVWRADRKLGSFRSVATFAVEKVASADPT